MAASDARTALAIHDRVKQWFPELKPIKVNLLEVRAGPGGAEVEQSAESSAWQFLSSDGFWIASLTPEWFGIETRRYDRWSGFRERLEALVAAVADHLEPALDQRVGLRYVDEIRSSVVKEPADWRGRITSSLLGPIADDELGGAVLNTQQLVQFEGEDSLRVALRHGSLQVDTGLQYLLDHDCFQQVARTFEAGSVMETFERLHNLARTVFKAAVEPTFYEELRMGGVD